MFFMDGMLKGNREPLLIHFQRISMSTSAHERNKSSLSFCCFLLFQKILGIRETVTLQCTRYIQAICSLQRCKIQNTLFCQTLSLSLFFPEVLPVVVPDKNYQHLVNEAYYRGEGRGQRLMSKVLSEILSPVEGEER